MSQEPSPTSDGLLVVGHGTRNVAGQGEFLQLVELAASRLTNVAVEPCFLELCEPAIPAAIERLVQRGCRRIAAVPLMLLAAGHVRKDIPHAVCEAIAPYSNVELRMTAHLGCRAGLLELSQLRRRECLETLGGAAAASSENDWRNSTLLLVSRGSTDLRSREEMYRIARLAAIPGREPAIVGFYAMVRPSLAAALEMANHRCQQRVIVQPHLLFQGELLQKIRQQVDDWGGGAGSGKQWVVTDHLGPHAILAEEIADLYQETRVGFSA